MRTHNALKITAISAVLGLTVVLLTRATFGYITRPDVMFSDFMPTVGLPILFGLLAALAVPGFMAITWLDNRQLAAAHAPKH